MHYPGALVLLPSLLFFVFLPTAHSQVQKGEPAANKDTVRAVETYQQGDAKEAINQLQAIVKRRPDDAEAWYHLGLALKSQGPLILSLPAFEQAVRLRPDFADAHAQLAYTQIFANQPQKALATASRALELGDFSAESHYAIAEASLRARDNLKAVEEAETALRINPNFTAALITKSLAHFQLRQYSEAAVSLELLLAGNLDVADAEMWRGQLEEMRHLISLESNPGPPIFNAKDAIQRARVTNKPEPQYSEAARQAQVTGMVALRAEFSADGEVKHIVVTRALTHGLTTQSIKAARQIRFVPAMKDGAPVSAYVQLEYNFNLY